jgi:enoyl-CoA hydratase/carnithine racemase
MVKSMSIAQTPLASTAPPLLQQTIGNILILTLNRPTARNPLSEDMLESLHQAVAKASASKSARAIIIAANGPVFCAGHDLKELTAHRNNPDGGSAYFDALIHRCSDLMAALMRTPLPVIAAVEGTATAAGCMLVASCDLAIAGEAAQFCTPGVQIGLFCSTPMVPLARNLSPKHALEMLLTGGLINAQDAFRFGLVNRVVPTGQAVPEAIAFATRIARQSPAAIRSGKRAFYRQLEMPLADALAFASRTMADDLMSADAKEGIAAFLNKRPAHWRSDGD